MVSVSTFARFLRRLRHCEGKATPPRGRLRRPKGLPFHSRERTTKAKGNFFVTRVLSSSTCATAKDRMKSCANLEPWAYFPSLFRRQKQYPPSFSSHSAAAARGKQWERQGMEACRRRRRRRRRRHHHQGRRHRRSHRLRRHPRPSRPRRPPSLCARLREQYLGRTIRCVERAHRFPL